MKFREMPGVTSEAKYDGIKFVVQMLDELLFDYTLDTYKPSMHYAGSLAREALTILDHVEEGGLDNHHFIEIIDELKDAIDGDDLAKNLINIDVRLFLAELAAEKAKDARARLAAISRFLDPEKYLRLAYGEIRKLVVDGREKKTLRKLTRTCVTGLLHAGYTRRFIRDRIRWHFFSYENNEADIFARLENFSEEFDSSKKYYEVYAAVPDVFRSIEATCNLLQFEIVSDTPDVSSIKNQIANAWSGYGCFLKTTMASIERYAAARDVERNIEKMANLFALYHHKKSLDWSEDLLVVDPVGGRQWLIERAVSPITRLLDARPEKAAQLLQRMVSKFTLEREAFERFDRIVDLHGAAVRTNATPVQLLNLWSAMESLVPPSVRGGKVKSVIDTLMPVLLLSYAKTLFDDLTADLFRWDKKVMREIFKNVGVATEVNWAHRLAMILLDETYVKVKDALIANTGNYALLRNRVFSLGERMSSPKKLIALLAIHEKRLRWQIKRIYRTRNLYVHSGMTVRLMDSLVENAHTYVDIYMKQIVSFSENASDGITFDEVHVVASQRLIEWRRLLGGLDSWTAETIDLVVSGS